jgi:hypothetical protein
MESLSIQSANNKALRGDVCRMDLYQHLGIFGCSFDQKQRKGDLKDGDESGMKSSRCGELK